MNKVALISFLFLAFAMPAKGEFILADKDMCPLVKTKAKEAMSLNILRATPFGYKDNWPLDRDQRNTAAITTLSTFYLAFCKD